MATAHISPHLVYADAQGQIFDHPHLKMLCRKGHEFLPPRPDELIPLPPDSEFFLLPNRQAVGLDQDSGQAVQLDSPAVAAFVCPGYTLTGLTAYTSDSEDVCPLPLFAYGAVGYARGRFYVCARKVDDDPRQQFASIPPGRIEQGTQSWLQAFPTNRLVRHLTACALTYSCPAAKNLALGRFEAPLPTSRACNAACVGCISLQEEDSGFPSTQNRISFRPRVKELTEIMHKHAAQAKRPILSFGQGCEGEPLLEAELLQSAISAFRSQGGQGTVNINTNASLPERIPPLARSGLNSIRVSLNSARPEVYTAYYRPKTYAWDHVIDSIQAAKEHGLFVSLNLLFFPGLTDTETEYDALASLIARTQVDFIQLRNLNLDPDLYLHIIGGSNSPCMGLKNFRRRLGKEFPWLGFGYFNPYLPPASSGPEPK